VPGVAVIIQFSLVFCGIAIVSVGSHCRFELLWGHAVGVGAGTEVACRMWGLQTEGWSRCLSNMTDGRCRR
jgi:hypothetical protein